MSLRAIDRVRLVTRLLTLLMVTLVVTAGAGCRNFTATVDDSSPATAMPAPTIEASGRTMISADEVDRNLTTFVADEVDRNPTRGAESTAGHGVRARFADAQATPVLTDTGFVVQASEIGSLRLVDEPRSSPVGVWIECFHFPLASLDAPVDSVGEPVIARTGGVYHLACWYEPGHDFVPGYPVVILFDPLEPVPGLVDVIDVAEFAQSRLDLDHPAVELSPAASQVVGIETWLAVTSELEYLDVTAQAGLAWATVRTTFRDVTWDLGDGSSLTCTDDATTTWNPSIRGDDQTSSCIHTYVESSADAGYPASATVTWSLEWINNEAPDSFVPWATFALTTPLDIVVDQLQAVIR